MNGQAAGAGAAMEVDGRYAARASDGFDVEFMPVADRQAECR